MKYSTIHLLQEKFKTRRIVVHVGILCIIGLLLICTMPVEQYRSESDIYFSYTIPIVALIGMAACIITKSRIIISVTDRLVMILYVYFLIRYYVDATFSAEGMVIHASSAFFLYVSLRILFSGIHLRETTIAVAILAYAVYETFYGIIQLFTGVSRHYLYPVTGSFNNPGPYSACLVMGLSIVSLFLKDPSNFVLDRLPISWKLLLSYIAHAMILIFVSVIILTMSRTAFIASALSMTIIFRERLRKWKWHCVVICILLSVGLYIIKSGSADGRFIINYVGLQAMADNPWFGIGIGGFFHQFAETSELLSINGSYIDLNAVDVIEYAFNDWLQIGVELGLCGLTLCIAITIWALCNLYNRSLSLYIVLIVILVFSFFSYPLELLPYRIIIIIMLSFASTSTETIESKRIDILRSVSIIVALTTVIAVWSIKASSRINQFRIAENDYNMMRGIDDPVLIKDYKPLIPLLSGNRDFLFDYARLLARQGRYNDSNDMLRRGTLISNDPMFLVLQGNNYRDMEAFEAAEEMYLKAWHTMPNRIYPLYRLMKLYEQTDDKAKCMDYAENVLNFKEKVSSPAVTDMKNEAKEIYTNGK